MSAGAPGSGRTRWLDVLGAVGAITIPAIVLVSFLTSGGDYDDTAADVIQYAEEHQGYNLILGLAALATPLLISLFVASLWGRLRGATEAYRALTLIGGALFVAFFSTSMLFWAAPLLASDELTTAGAEAYLAFDDFGWVMLGTGGMSMGVLIIGVSLAARELGLLPRWTVVVSLVLGVLSLATVIAVGIFAWTIWTVAAGGYLLLHREHGVPPVEAREPQLATT